MKRIVFLFLIGCGSSADPIPHSNGRGPAPFDPGSPYTPKIAATELSPNITQRLFPLPAGAHWVFETPTDQGLERAEITVSSETHAVWGASARIVRDTVTRDGAVIEDTIDWFAQDAAGNVWYLGEDTKEYENGHVTTTKGSWESGVGGALLGVIMLAQPAVGDVYRQEYLAREAEDVAEVIALDVSVTVRAGSFTHCVETRERSAVEPELDETKTYCPGVGNVLVVEGDTREELIEYSGL